MKKARYLFPSDYMADPSVDVNSVVENMYGRVCHIISRN